MGQCKNCAWYCHADGMCYAREISPIGDNKTASAVNEPEEHGCGEWSFDGLEEWERTAFAV